MSDTSGLREDAAACDFVALFLADRDGGRARPLAEYQSLVPEFRDRIATEFDELVRDLEASPAPVGELERLGPYRLIRQLGRGGQGVVYLAEHEQLARRAAVKVLHEGGLGFSTARVARLRREAQVLASLDDASICAVYDAALDAPRPYLAMRYVEGETLAALLDRAREGGGELPPTGSGAIDAWLAFFETAARALDAAHRVGVVHRDVKPQNLMRASDGRPVLLDFGLARQVDSTTLVLTQPHEVFGTLPYMAPELLRGSVEPDPRVDVYALGVTLYEVVTGSLPFAAVNPDALRRQIETGDAAPVRRLNRALPRGLDVVLRVAIDVDPERRYASAALFADDLRRLRLGEPISARRDGPLRATRLWARRHPLLATTFALVTTGLVATLGLLALVLRGQRELEALRLAYQAESLSEQTPARALHLAVEAAHIARHPEIDDILLRILDRCWEERSIDLPQRAGGAPDDLLPCGTLEVSDCGRRLAVPRSSGRVAVWRLASGALEAELDHGRAGRTAVLFAAGGDSLWTAGADGVVRAWGVDGSGGEPRWTLPDQGVSALARGPHGRTLAIAGDAGAVRLVDAGSDASFRVLDAHRGCVTQVEFDRGGACVLTVGGDWGLDLVGDGTVRVWEVPTGALLLTLGPFGSRPLHAAWDAEGARIAVGLADGAVRVHRVSDGASVASFGHARDAAWVGFTPDGARLVTGGADGLVAFDLSTGAQTRRHDDFQDRSVAGGRFSPDGRMLAVFAFDNTARVYDARTLELVRVLRSAAARPFDLRWAPDGRRLVTLDYGVHVWFADGRPFLPVLRGHRDRVVAAEFDASGGRALTASADGTARVWRVGDGACLAVLEHGAPLVSARFSAAADRVVTCAVDGRVTVWRGESAVWALAVPDGGGAWFAETDRTVVTTGRDGCVRGFGADDGEPRFSRRVHDAAIECVAWHASRPWLASGAADRTVSVLDVRTGESVFRSAPWEWAHRSDAGRRVFGVAFSPVADVVVASCEDLRMRAWDVARGREAWVGAPAATPGAVAFSLEGRRLLVAGQWSAFVAIDDAASGERVGLAPIAPSNVVARVRVSEQTGVALCAGKDGRVSVFEIEPPRLARVFRASAAPVLDAAFSPDGRAIITASADGLARIWPVDPLPVAERVAPARITPVRGR